MLLLFCGTGVLVGEGVGVFEDAAVGVGVLVDLALGVGVGVGVDFSSTV